MVKLATDRPYLLAVSAIKENKIYENLIRAFALACSRLVEPMALLMADEAEDRGCFLRVKKLVQENNLTSRVRFLGDVGPAALLALYGGSLGLVFPSKRESLGLPPLEAMTYGVPVAASHIEPVEEVCGDAALYFSPDNIQEIAETMIRLATDDLLRSRAALCVNIG